MSKCQDDHGNDRHAWERTGLDNIDVNRLRPTPVGRTGEVLCSTRRCVWCGVKEAKPYGDGGNKPWRRVTT